MRVRSLFAALCICLFVFPVVLVAQGTILWADTIDIGYDDGASGVAVDNSNNIIVTGHCIVVFPPANYDYYTVKYDSNGTILWADTLAYSHIDWAHDIAVDNFNNIIVTGTTGEPYWDFDYFTVKYDSNGTIQWTDTIDNGFYDFAWGVAVDNSNNIIVTGRSEIGDVDNWDYFTVKYNPSGTILWADTIDNGGIDIAYGVAVDNSNNIIITGTSKIGVDWDYFTVKYDSNGTIQWADTIDNGDDDEAWSVAVDDSNNIIVTGKSEIGSDYDYFTVKYDTNGTIQWADTIDNGDDDESHGVAVDDSNNIIVTGKSEIGSSGDYFTVKYDANGTVQWADTIDNGDYDAAWGVAVDNSNNIIVTGSSRIDGDSDIFTVKYAPYAGISEDEGSGLLSGPTLCDIYPNPFSDKLEIRLMIEDERWKMGDISLRIYDVTGRCIKSFSLSPTYSLLPTVISWDGRNNAGEKVTSGVYFLRFTAGDYKETKQLLMIK
ncbi:T9SS type A sorting domain-containing protein [candidate division WOR-3 bacterium]|nr:T9SS type A sorting domain-containing protein [candidate division WOR-3 bacterium]